MGKILVLSFSDDKEETYQRMLQIISNSKNFEWCNMLQETKEVLLLGIQKLRLQIENLKYCIC